MPKPDSPERTAALAALREEFALVDPAASAQRHATPPTRAALQAAVDALSEERRAAYRRRLADLERALPGAPLATIDQFVDHIDYAIKLIGIDHVGISSDSDGGGGIDGWRDASETFNVTLELVRRGYSEADIAKIWSGNLLRVMDRVQRVATELQKP